MLHIMLTEKKRSDDPDDPLDRTFYGWDPQAAIEENWGNNRGYWVLGARANRESYVLFSHNERHVAVMAARVDMIIDAPGQARPEDHRRRAAARGPSRVPGVRRRADPGERASAIRSPISSRLSAAGCAAAAAARRSTSASSCAATSRPHCISALPRSGTVPEFLRWFDAVRAGTQAGSQDSPLR